MKNKLQVKEVNVDGANKFALIFDSIDELLDTVYTLGVKDSKKTETGNSNSNRKLKLIKGVKRSSSLVGVTWNKPLGAWNARIKIKGVSYYLGSFDNELDASNAYQKAKKSLFKRLA